MSAAAVFLAALVTALSTGLGALPLLLGRRIERLLGLGTALAAGFMAGASAALVWEGIGLSLWRTPCGILLGALFIFVTTRALGHRHHHAHFGVLRGADALGALMIVGVMTLHSFTEGIASASRSARAPRSVRSSPPRSPCTTSRRASPSAWCSCRAASRWRAPRPGA